MSEVASPRPTSGWAKLKRNFVAFAEAAELSEPELQARRIARLEQRLIECERQLATFAGQLQNKEVTHDQA